MYIRNSLKMGTIGTSDKNDFGWIWTWRSDVAANTAGDAEHKQEQNSTFDVLNEQNFPEEQPLKYQKQVTNRNVTGLCWPLDISETNNEMF